jgi:chromosome segregation and condensation protein ScpB
MSLVPNHRERQMMQRLRGRGWVKAIELPENPVTLQRLLEKHWVESQGTGRDVAYRITEEGLVAKKAPVRL